MATWKNEEEARAQIKKMVSDYYHEFKEKKEPYKEGNRITYAARIFDEKEMCALTDATLDFWLTTGRFAEKFERDFASWLGVKYAHLVNSGSSANLIAFMTLTAPELGERQIKKGDEVITVACGFPTTITPIIQYDAIPVFVDVTIPQYNIDVTKLEKALSPKTKAVMVAHTLGNPFDLQAVKEFCEKNQIRHIVCQSEELDIEGFRNNPKNRCYLCKHELFEKIWEIAKENGMNAVAEGSNMDDNGDYRPGLIAVKELGVSSPLRQAELYKEEIRELSKEMGLPTWDKQSFACLSSRFVYGETISEKKLGMVDKAEQLLLDMGFHQVRVRIHGLLARIEIMPEEFPKLLEKNVREDIVEKFKEYGFTYVTMDILGYRMGSMNETLGEKDKTAADSSLKGKNE